ncbi:MAG: methionyl-tRNA formyltransferase [Alphaproteobacteria bacterium]
MPVSSMPVSPPPVTPPSGAVIIGNGRMAADCLRVLDREGVRVGLVLNSEREDPQPARVEAACARAGVPLLRFARLNRPEIVERVAALAPDFLLNVDSFAILGDALLAVPRIATINFHNGPLPRYRGIHVCSWAIVEGASDYGVTWHVMEKAIDAGDVLAERHFPLPERVTAQALTIQCLMEGIRLFPDVARQIAAGRLDRRPQDHAAARYYGLKDRPYGGWFPFTAARDELDRLIRAVDFGGTRNRFFEPALTLAGQDFRIVRCRWEAEEAPPAPPGTVLAAGARGLVLATPGGAVRLDLVPAPAADVGDAGAEVAENWTLDAYGIAAGAAAQEGVGA